MTIEEELHAAAQKLQSVAHASTMFGLCTWQKEADEEYWVYDANESLAYIAWTQADAMWAAMMGPEMASPLAALLIETRDRVKRERGLYHQLMDDRPFEEWAQEYFGPMLTIAGLINAERKLP